MEVCEISLLQDAGEVFGETRDFGPHMGRSSSEVHRQTSSALGRVYDASPGDLSGQSYFTERSDSTSDIISTPTQGFAPVHFTDRSPKSVTTHPKPVPGRRVMVLPQSPVASTDLKSEGNSIAEDAEIGTSEVVLSGQCDISTTTDEQLTQDANDGWTEFSSAPVHSTQDNPDEFSNKSQIPSSLSAGGNVASKSQSEDQTEPVSGGPCPSEAEATDADVDKLGSQVSDVILGAAGERVDGSGEDPSKPRESSPKSSFSPLRTPAQHISSFFNYTSSFFRNASTADKEKPSASPPLGSDGKGKYFSLPPDPPIKFKIKSEFTKADIARALGPDPKGEGITNAGLSYTHKCLFSLPYLAKVC